MGDNLAKLESRLRDVIDLSPASSGSPSATFASIQSNLWRLERGHISAKSLVVDRTWRGGDLAGRPKEFRRP